MRTLTYTRAIARTIARTHTCTRIDAWSPMWVATWQSNRQDPLYPARYGRKIQAPGSALRHDKNLGTW